MFFFYSFISLLVFCSVRMIIVQNPVQSVFYLILCFCNAAILVLLLGCDFLAIAFVIIYVGAIAILFLFVVIMLRVERNSYVEEGRIHFTWGLYFLLCFIIFSCLSWFNFQETLLNEPFPYSTFISSNWFIITDSLTFIEKIGQVLYTQYLLSFLVAGFILLLAMIVAVSLASKQFTSNRINKKQQAAFQISRNLHNKVILLISN